MTLRNLSSPNDPYLRFRRLRLLLRRPRPQRARPTSHPSHQSIIQHRATTITARKGPASPFRRISLLRRPIASFPRRLQPHLHLLHRHQHSHSRLWSISRTKTMIFPWLPPWQRDIEVLSRRVLMIFTAAVKRYVASKYFFDDENPPYEYALFLSHTSFASPCIVPLS